MLNYDIDEVIKRAIKYIIEGGAVAIAAYYIPRKTMNMEEIAVIALTAAATFSILDLTFCDFKILARPNTQSLVPLLVITMFR